MVLYLVMMEYVTSAKSKSEAIKIVKHRWEDIPIKVVKEIDS